MTATLLQVGLGVFFGFFVGRWSAESRRARFDMGKTWDGRKNYRK